MRISLFVTCLADVMRPKAAQAVVRILRRLGHEVDFPPAQTCCGQPMFNSGYAQLARDQARHTLQAFADSELIVCPSGSCAAMVKHEYPHLLADDPNLCEQSKSLAARTFEFTDFLVNHLQVSDVGAKFAGKVAYHYACHLRMLGLSDEGEQLIRGVAGAELLPLPRQSQCCGFGGSFSVRYPQISGALVDDKADCVIQTEADLLVSTDTGCLMNIGGRLHRLGKPVEVLHLAELLDRQ